MKELMGARELDVRERPLPWDLDGRYTHRNIMRYMPKDAGKPIKLREPRDRSNTGKETMAVIASRSRSTVHGPQSQLSQEDEEVVVPPKEPIGFFDLPPEVRDMIYQNLLVQPNRTNIVVQKGWTKVFERPLHRSNLSPRPDFPIGRLAGLRNRQFMNEALAVLYGENTFEYFFRDAAETIEVSAANDGNASESASDADRSFNDGQGGCKPKPGKTINIDKFGYMMRNLALRIESNRTGPEYRNIMAQSIDVFNRLRGRKANIHTITIHISPTWTNDDTVSYTDYFVEDSVITNALKRLVCQFIKIIIHTPRHRAVEVKIDRRYAAAIRRAGRGKEEYQLNSDVSNIRRGAEATKEWKKMNSIAQKIRNVCVDEAGPARSATPFTIDGEGDATMTDMNVDMSNDNLFALEEATNS